MLPAKRWWLSPHVVATAAMSAILATYIALGQVLSPWWFRTDYCPQDPNLYCGGVAPVTYLLLSVSAAVAVGVGAALRWRGDV